MERLTKYEPCEGGIPLVTVEDEQSALQRLAAYEDTGLTPEGVAALQTHPDHAYADYVKTLWAGIGGMDKMEELAHAEEQGLLIRLPCRVGDTLTIGYDRSEQNDIPTLTVARVRAWRVCIIKSVYGEEAEWIYKELTEERRNAQDDN